MKGLLLSLALLIVVAIAPSEQVGFYPYPLKESDLTVPVISPEWCPLGYSCDDSEEYPIYAMVGCCCSARGVESEWFKFVCSGGVWVEDQSDYRFRCPFNCEY